MTAADLIQQIRIEVGDNITPTIADLPPSHLARKEPSLGLINGTNTIFQVRHFPIIASGISAGVDLTATDANGVVLAVTSVQRNFGQFVLTVPPTAGKVEATYYSMFATDTEWLAFLNAGLRYCSQLAAATTATVVIVPDGLIAGITEYAKAKYYEKLTQQTAAFFDFSAGGKTVNKSSVPQNWKALMAAATELARTLRNDFYNPRQGRALAPAQGFQTPGQRGQPWTPTR